MKQKITIKVQMKCDKCRNKALKIAAVVKGVSSVSIEGDEKDRVVVTGENVDTICLGKLLKEKFRCVTVLTVEEVKAKPAQKKDDKKKEKEKDRCGTVCIVPCNPCLKCCSPKCAGQCSPCSRCHSPKCDGDCKPCSRCESYKCHGQCTSTCFRPPCHGQCPPWNPCPSCCVKRPPPCPSPCDPYCYRVVYDPNPDSCSLQ